MNKLTIGIVGAGLVTSFVLFQNFSKVNTTTSLPAVDERFQLRLPRTGDHFDSYLRQLDFGSRPDSKNNSFKSVNGRYELLAKDRDGATFVVARRKNQSVFEAVLDARNNTALLNVKYSKKYLPDTVIPILVQGSLPSTVSRRTFLANALYDAVESGDSMHSEALLGQNTLLEFENATDDLIVGTFSEDPEDPGCGGQGEATSGGPGSIAGDNASAVASAVGGAISGTDAGDPGNTSGGEPPDEDTSPPCDDDDGGGGGGCGDDDEVEHPGVPITVQLLEVTLDGGTEISLNGTVWTGSGGWGCFVGIRW